MTEVGPGDVARRIGGSTLWSTSSAIGSQAIRFVLFVLLSRLVTPREFGVVALASVFIELFTVLAIGGLSDALVRKPELSEEDADTAFWTKLGTGVVFCGAGVMLSPLIAGGLKTPDLAPVMQWLCLSLVIWPLGATHTARLSRGLQLRSLALRTLGANVLGAVLGIALAFAGYGVWALVARSLATTAALVLFSWLAFPWLPGFKFRLASWRRLSGFGSRLMGAQLVSQLNLRGLELIAGLLIAPAAVGVLRIGGQCFSLLTQISVAPVSAVALPLLSRTQGDPAAAREVFARVARLSALLIYPTFFGAMAVSDRVFPLLFGPNWALTGAVMPLLCALAVPAQLNTILSASLASRGAAGAVLKWNLFQAAVGLPIAAIGAHWGLFPMLVLTVARSYLLLPLGLVWLGRNTEFSPRSLVGASLRPLLASLIMAGLVGVVGAAIAPSAPRLPVIAVLVGLGALTYAVLILALLPEIRRTAGARLAGLGRALNRRGPVA